MAHDYSDVIDHQPAVPQLALEAADSKIARGGVALQVLRELGLTI
jgi:hypothetical protein